MRENNSNSILYVNEYLLAFMINFNLGACALVLLWNNLPSDSSYIQLSMVAKNCDGNLTSTFIAAINNDTLSN